MQKRLNIRDLDPKSYSILLTLEAHIRELGIEGKLFQLIKIRASQINGCAFCINMHTKDARKEGETEQRIYMLNAWKEAPYFTDAEKAALAVVEAVTLISQNHLPDDVYDNALKYFSEQQLAAILMAIVAINSWNRISISCNAPPQD